MENWTKILACKFYNFVLKCTLEGGGNDMRKREKRTHRGFTLIELVIVITILAILAAVAIPAFQNLTVKARNAAAQGAVGGLRSAVAVYYANELANNRTGAYPALSAMDDAVTGVTNPMANGDIPDNPWCSTGTTCSGNPDAVTSGAVAARTTTNLAFGWRYEVTTGLIYANSALNTDGSPENSF